MSLIFCNSLFVVLLRSVLTRIRNLVCRVTNQYSMKVARLRETGNEAFSGPVRLLEASLWRSVVSQNNRSLAEKVRGRYRAEAKQSKSRPTLQGLTDSRCQDYWTSRAWFPKANGACFVFDIWKESVRHWEALYSYMPWKSHESRWAWKCGEMHHAWKFWLVANKSWNPDLMGNEISSHMILLLLNVQHEAKNRRSVIVGSHCLTRGWANNVVSCFRRFRSSISWLNTYQITTSQLYWNLTAGSAMHTSQSFGPSNLSYNRTPVVHTGGQIINRWRHCRSS